MRLLTFVAFLLVTATLGTAHATALRVGPSLCFDEHVTCEFSGNYSSVTYGFQALEKTRGENAFGGWGISAQSYIRQWPLVKTPLPGFAFLDNAEVQVTLQFKVYWSGMLAKAREAMSFGLFNLRVSYEDEEGHSNVEQDGFLLSDVGSMALVARNDEGAYYVCSSMDDWQTFTLRVPMESFKNLRAEVRDVGPGTALYISSLRIEVVGEKTTPEK